MNRASFHTRYAIPEAALQPHRNTLRLMDCNICVMQLDEKALSIQPNAGEFCVIDFKTQEKGIFEIPFNGFPDVLQRMVESHFAATATRLDSKTWIV